MASVGNLASDDQSDDETEPLVAARVATEAPVPTATWSQVWTILVSMRWVLFLAVLNTVLMRAQTVVYFPYLRSLQHCDVPVVAGAIHTGEWSGSDACGDRALVAREERMVSILDLDRLVSRATAAQMEQIVAEQGKPADAPN